MPSAGETKIALERAEKLVTIAPEKGRRTYANRAVIADGTRCETTEKDFALLVDAGKGLGGGTDGPTPSTLLRSAVTSCIAIGVKLWAARRDVPIDYVEVVLETDTDARGILGLDESTRPGFTGLRAVIDIRSPAPPEQIEEIVAISLRHSPLVDALTHANALETRTRIERGERQLALEVDHGR